MDLERAKAIWQREKLEFLREKSLKERAADIRRKAEELEQKFKREQKTRLTYGIICLVLMASQYDPHLPLLSNAGLGLMVLCGAAGLASYCVLRRRYRESRLELPRREYLAEQRKNLREQILVLCLNAFLLVPPAGFGLYLWQAGWSHSEAQILLIILLIVIALVSCVLALLWKIFKELLPAIREIDLELNQLE
jgi:hypothetical protein